MKKLLVASLLLGLLAPAAFGQYGQAIKRAKETANQNNVRQGVPSPAQTPPRPVAPAAAKPATNSVVTAAQSLAKLKADLAGFKPGAVITAEQKQQFTVDLAHAARGTKPSLPIVKKFVDSLTAALSGATLVTEQQARLAQNIDAVLNARGTAATQFDKIIEDTQAILQVGSVGRFTAIGVANDLKAIGAEVRR
jgi:hypothetical protein